MVQRLQKKLLNHAKVHLLNVYFELAYCACVFLCNLKVKLQQKLQRLLQPLLNSNIKTSSSMSVTMIEELSTVSKKLKLDSLYPLDTGRRLNVRKTFRRCPRRL